MKFRNPEAKVKKDKPQNLHPPEGVKPLQRQKIREKGLERYQKHQGRKGKEGIDDIKKVHNPDGYVFKVMKIFHERPNCIKFFKGKLIIGSQ
jgi:hypothetical protein